MPNCQYYFKPIFATEIHQYTTHFLKWKEWVFFFKKRNFCRCSWKLLSLAAVGSSEELSWNCDLLSTSILPSFKASHNSTPCVLTQTAPQIEDVCILQMPAAPSLQCYCAETFTKSFWAICSLTQILSHHLYIVLLVYHTGLKLLTGNPCSRNRICGTISFLKSLPSSYQGLFQAWLWEKKNWEWMKTIISSQNYCEYMVAYFSLVCWGFFVLTVQRLNVNVRGEETK